MGFDPYVDLLDVQGGRRGMTICGGRGGDGTNALLTQVRIDEA